MTVTLSNRAHPEYGGVQVDLPIMDKDYDITMEYLSSMGIGHVSERDCEVERIVSTTPALDSLVGKRANIDELDFLARQMDSFSKADEARYQAMAFLHGYSNIQDLINLSPKQNFQKATVITSFRNLQSAGREHYKMLNPDLKTKELEKVDFEKVAMNLILKDHSGRITPYGVTYDYNSPLQEFYDGHALPHLNEPEGMLELVVTKRDHIPDRMEFTYLYLPMPAQRLERMLERGGFTEGEQLNIGIACHGCDIRLLPDSFDETSPQDFNWLAKTLASLSPKECNKLIAAKEFARATQVEQIVALADNLDLFDYYPDFDSAETCLKQAEDIGQPAVSRTVSNGYVVCYNAQEVSELMAAEEKHFAHFQMGGMA